MFIAGEIVAIQFNVITNTDKVFLRFRIYCPLCSQTVAVFFFLYIEFYNFVPSFHVMNTNINPYYHSLGMRAVKSAYVCRHGLCMLQF